MACGPRRLALFGGPGWTRFEGVKRPECAYSAQLRMGTLGLLHGGTLTTAPGAGRCVPRAKARPLLAFGNEHTHVCPASLSLGVIPLWAQEITSTPLCGRNWLSSRFLNVDVADFNSGHGDRLRAECVPQAHQFRVLPRRSPKLLKNTLFPRENNAGLGWSTTTWLSLGNSLKMKPSRAERWRCMILMALPAAGSSCT